jgi:dolichol-phosphate mannosyltransferase
MDLRGLDLVCEHFDIIEEILYKLRQRNPALRIREIPFTFKKRMFGETKRNLLAFILSYAYTMIRLRCLKSARPPGNDRGA